MMVRKFIGVLGLSMLLSSASFAATELAPIGADNPYLKDIEATTERLGKELDPSALKHLYYIREGFGATRVVLIVRKDVEDATKACSKANPDMKDSITAEFQGWAAEVDPVIKEKQALMDQAIKSQTYAKPKEIRDYLSLIEKAGNHANNQIDKQIVTTPEACTKLKDSMTTTKTVVSKLLNDVQFLVWPLPEDRAKTTIEEDRKKQD